MPHSRTISSSTIPAPPPSPIPTGTGSRSAANEVFKQFLENSIHLPLLSLPKSRFVSGADPSPAVVDFKSLASPEGGEAAARMLWSANEFGAFRIVNHGIVDEEILSVVNEFKYRLEDWDKGVDDRRWVGEVGNREVILQVRRRSDSAGSAVQAETYRNISEKMEKIGSKLEGIAEKLGEILCCMGKKWEKESILSIYRHNRQEMLEKKKDEEGESNGNVMLNLQLFVNPHEQSSAASHAILVTIAKKLQETSSGKLKSARNEMTFEQDLLGTQTFFSIELKFLNPNLFNHHPNSNIISIYDQIFIPFLLLSLYFLYTSISSFFQAK